jgi:hypothetical protein
MKKIGFIDHSIDEWHANNYPSFIRSSSFKENFEVALAWEKISAPGKKDLSQWCEEQRVSPASSIEQLVAECDCLVVLAPDHPESHEELADLALRSGKPVYIDKPFASSLVAAKRMFELARQHRTPLMSSSALRYGSALQQALSGYKKISFAGTRGGGSSFAEYAIHQVEMLVMSLGTGVKRVLASGSEGADLLLLDYEDGRSGVLNLVEKHPFQITLRGENSGGASQTEVIDEMSDFFPGFIEALLAFFDSGVPSVPSSETLEIIAILQAAEIARSARNQWVQL